MKKFSAIVLIGMMACHSSSRIKKTTTVTAPSVTDSSSVSSATSAATTSTATANPELAKAMIKVPGITSERLAEGNKVYMQDCTRCHGMKEPSNYTMEQWEPILLRMFVKAKITDEHEKVLIRDYVIAKSK